MLKLIIGCGYLGARVAKRWRAAGNEVAIVTRSLHRANQFEHEGYHPIIADVARPETLNALPTAETILFAVGYDRASADSIMDVYGRGVHNVLQALPRESGPFMYISSTGVYGPAGGDWVDENTPTDPQRDGGRASLAAEQALAAHPLGKRSTILRLAGIYGPGRIPFIQELRDHQPIAAPSTGFLNLIHVDDAAAVVTAAAASPTFSDGPRVYCVSDGHPVARQDFYREAARIIGAPPPTFVEPDPSSPRAERARGNRRVRNDRMLAALQVTLTYPDYRAGLAVALETENQ
jgi:nucleoside-diphosphate-sugar epimerase